MTKLLETAFAEASKLSPLEQDLLARRLLAELAAITPRGTANPEFLKQHRDREVDFLREWVELLGDQDIANWLITVVSKADLWWQRREQVVKFYERGRYFSKLGSART